MGQVTCVGLTTLDVVQVVGRVPGPDEKVVATDGWVAFGGPAANAAATSAALGAPTRLVTALGTGPVADLARAGLVAAGVEVVDLAPDVADLTPVSSVLVTGASRAVVSRNATAAPDLAAAARSRQVAVGGVGDVLLVDGHHLGAALVLARAARVCGVQVLLDGGSWKPGLGDLLALVDVAVLSADFRLPGVGGDGGAPDVADLLVAVAGCGPAVVARSAGAGPLLLRQASGEVVALHPEAVRVQDQVDTLGAGDVLHGAVAAALASGAPVRRALGTGVRWATESVRHRGALGWVGAARAGGTSG